MADSPFTRGHRETIRARPIVGRDSSFGETFTSDPSQTNAKARVSSEPEVRLGSGPLVAADLYRDAEALSPAFVRASALLVVALKLASEGIQLLKEDPIAADLNVQSLRPVLRKLFICRQVGDGFAAVVDSLISALDNNRGMPLTEARFTAVHNALLKLREEPFLSFAIAVNVIEGIELVGFSTEPPGFEQLADWLTV